MTSTQQAEARDAKLAAVHFEAQWRNYRKVIDNNYIFHREVYALLHRILTHEIAKPFAFLDIACGDASASAGALRDTRVARYYGIDLSQPALDLARAALATLGCPGTLERRDFVDALPAWTAPVDVVWIGQSLHHLLAPDKLALMRDIRRILDGRGLLLIWEPTMREGESRDAWLDRFEGDNRPLWSALSSEEWEAVVAHNRAADFPETAPRWLALGLQAGFVEAEEVFVAPSDLARMYLYRVSRR